LQLSGGRRSLTEGFAYWANQSYLLQYTLRAIANIGGNSNDIKNYVSGSSAGLGGVFAAASTTTSLSIASEIFAEKIEGVFGNKIVAPRFQTLLTSSGELLLGVQTIVRPGGGWPSFEVSLDSTPTFSAFSLGVKAHDIRVPYISNLSVSPFLSLSNWGVSGGTDVTYDFNSRLGVSFTAGYRDSSNPLNDVEGKEAGIYGKAAATVSF